ncbi:unnamed protein product [Sphenostylis stenocarpa]|uniref:Tudor domain-containing protein n=1 Tax=Sphenostylis stenocarpa TaxID=92480 RepID=A0AA86SJ45_9FABA|nr:unnamed protein product [Sphenostylis stenocarpa]
MGRKLTQHPEVSALSLFNVKPFINSEQISPDLLRPLLDSVGNENQTISPMSWTLGEKVISNCTVKLKPYLMKAVESSGRALNGYAQIVSDICQNESESPQCDDSNVLIWLLIGNHGTNLADFCKFSRNLIAAVVFIGLVVSMLQVQEDESKLNVPNDAKDQTCDETKGQEPDVTGQRNVQSLDDTEPNRSATIDGEAIKKSGSKRRSHFEITKNSRRGSAKAKLETDNLESAQEPKSETQLNSVPRKRGRKPNSLMNAEEGYDHSWVCRETKVGNSTLSRKTRNCSAPFPSSEKSTSKTGKLHGKPKTVSETPVYEPKSENIAKPAKSKRTHNIASDFPPNDTSEGREALSSKPKTDEYTDVSPSINNNISDGCHIKRGQRRKKNSIGNQGVHSNSLSMLKEDNLTFGFGRLDKESEVRNDSEQKPIRRIKFSVKIDGKLVMAPESVAKREPNVPCGDEGKHKSSMNDELENIEKIRFSTQTNVKKRRRLDATPNEGLNKSSALKELIAESANKTLNGVMEIPQARLRRRHSNVSAEVSESHHCGNSLVGSKIKVWWPKDKTFYEGVIESYDPIKGKHKILYADGDVEVLNLKRQRWKLVAVDVSLDEEGLALQRLAEASDILEFGRFVHALILDFDYVKYESLSRTNPSTR